MQIFFETANATDKFLLQLIKELLWNLINIIRGMSITKYTCYPVFLCILILTHI
jgi:hypothetical protein